MVKPGTLSYDPKSNCYKFIITDSTFEVSVLFKTSVGFETKEGETVVITGYFPDLENKS